MSSSAIVSLVIAALIVLLILVVIGRTIRLIQQGLVGVVKRLGQYQSVRNPGVTFLVPFIDRMEAVDMRETPRTGDRQDVITKDNVSVVVNATIFSQVVDPRLALFSVSNYLLAVDQISRTTLRAIFGEMSLDEALSQREQINTRLQNQMETVTDKWGVRINRVEILDIVPPQNILQAMALQKQADQEKRAAILQSEGQQLSQINVAEGQKQAQIKQAERQKAEPRRSPSFTAQSRAEHPPQSCWRCSSWTPWASSRRAPTRRCWFRLSRPGFWARLRRCARCWMACRAPIRSRSKRRSWQPAGGRSLPPAGGLPQTGPRAVGTAPFLRRRGGRVAAAATTPDGSQGRRATLSGGACLDGRRFGGACPSDRRPIPAAGS